jgi:hypothetical protein
MVSVQGFISYISDKHPAKLYGTGVIISERNTHDPVKRKESDDCPRDPIENLLVFHSDELSVKRKRAVDDHKSENAEACARIKADTTLEIHKVLAVIPKLRIGDTEKLNDIRSRKLNYGSDEAYVNEEQKESYVQLADIKGLWDLLMEDAVYKHAAESVNGKPRTEENASVSPDTVVEIRPDYLVYPAAYGEKYKQQ